MDDYMKALNRFRVRRRNEKIANLFHTIISAPISWISTTPEPAVHIEQELENVPLLEKPSVVCSERLTVLTRRRPPVHAGSGLTGASSCFWSPHATVIG